MTSPSTPGPPVGDEDLFGQRLADRYRILERIGQGGMATVYKAQDEHLGREVALKVFHRGLASSDDLQRQQSEMRHLARLSHPCLVGLHDAISDDQGRSFLVLEYVPGQDLRSRLRRCPLSAAHAARIGVDVAHALAYIHSRQLVHRDVSPGNILLVPNSSPHDHVAAKLTDLGVARAVDASQITATGTLIGTAAYLSPEQARGLTVTPASDLYSLGLVLLECLTGERAFRGAVVESAVARLSRDPEIPEHLPAPWRDLLTAMTARDPAQRPTASDAAQALAAQTLAEDSPADAKTAPLDAVDQSTQTLPTTPPPAGETKVLPAADARLRASALLDRLRQVSPLWLFGTAAAAIALIALVIIALNLPGPQPTLATPKYPTVPGQLGVHLKQLERNTAP